MKEGRNIDERVLVSFETKGSTKNNIEIGERARTSAFHHVHELCAFTDGFTRDERIFAGFDFWWTVETFFPSPENMYKVIVLHALSHTHTHTHTHIYIHIHTFKFTTGESVRVHTVVLLPGTFCFKQGGGMKKGEKNGALRNFQKNQNGGVTSSMFVLLFRLCAGTIARRKEKRESSN